MIVLASVLLTGVGVALIYLRPPSLVEVHVEEIQRLASVDGRVEAVVQLSDGGATTSRAYCVFIVPKGAKPADQYRMVTLDGPTLRDGKYGIVIGWASPTVLEVGSVKVKEVFDFQGSISIRGAIYRVLRKS